MGQFLLRHHALKIDHGSMFKDHPHPPKHYWIGQFPSRYHAIRIMAQCLHIKAFPPMDKQKHKSWEHVSTQQSSKSESKPGNGTMNLSMAKQLQNKDNKHEK